MEWRTAELAKDIMPKKQTASLPGIEEVVSCDLFHPGLRI
jgi:hypothetical protein